MSAFCKELYWVWINWFIKTPTNYHWKKNIDNTEGKKKRWENKPVHWNKVNVAYFNWNDNVEKHVPAHLCVSFYCENKQKQLKLPQAAKQHNTKPFPTLDIHWHVCFTLVFLFFPAKHQSLHFILLSSYIWLTWTLTNSLLWKSLFPQWFI